MSQNANYERSVASRLLAEVIKEYNAALALDEFGPLFPNRMGDVAPGTLKEVNLRSVKSTGKAVMTAGTESVEIVLATPERSTVTIPVWVAQNMAQWGIMEINQGSTIGESLVQDHIDAAFDMIMKTADDFALSGQSGDAVAKGSFAKQSAVNVVAAAAKANTYTASTAGTLWAELLGRVNRVNEESDGKRTANYFAFPVEPYNFLDSLMEENTNISMLQRLRNIGVTPVKIPKLKDQGAANVTRSVCFTNDRNSGYNGTGLVTQFFYNLGPNYYAPHMLPTFGFYWSDLTCVNYLDNL